jgi:hypothetical protein
MKTKTPKEKAIEEWNELTPEQQCDNSNGNISDIIDIALQAQADENESKIASARSEVYDNMNAELNKCQEQHKAKIKEIELWKMYKQLQTENKCLKKQHQEEIDALKVLIIKQNEVIELRNKQLKEQQKQHEEQMIKLCLKYREDIDNLERQHKAKIKEIRNWISFWVDIEVLKKFDKKFLKDGGRR